MPETKILSRVDRIGINFIVKSTFCHKRKTTVAGHWFLSIGKKIARDSWAWKILCGLAKRMPEPKLLRRVRRVGINFITKRAFFTQEDTVVASHRCSLIGRQIAKKLACTRGILRGLAKNAPNEAPPQGQSRWNKFHCKELFFHLKKTQFLQGTGS